ncbi:GNAT family N-acetyltransferase [Anaerocolumna xylanovorans]|uniref:GNAT acetyltransferase n=1 Tax=Anaerocolumna xylanovorans DSM 12503 TaxID=1121345 RepID=A0A1M7XZ81_9FIRM|nr:GNAT family N-acetyltransferase [Anaerocolumna xylanovorans]SHO44419.1 GNAT acetyltransferase [Anaerocolumna xylanovorans DSM 12503]
MPQIEHLFDGWSETLIWSCLQGYMGHAYADNSENPVSAQIIIGDFCFFAGVPNTELTANIPCDHLSDSILMIPESDGWSRMIEEIYPFNSKKTLRYAIKKETDAFDREKLHSYIQGLSSEYTLKMMDEALYELAKSEDWSCDLCSQFPSYKDYQAHGIGVMALFNGLPVSGASSYTVYDQGIEIEIDTRTDFRRKGLALACGAKLILECLDRNLYPSWDAIDLRSVSLAEKLGYHLDKEYITYIVSTDNNYNRSRE